MSWNNKGLYYKSWWLSCTPKSERPNMECICFKALDSGHSPLTGMNASIKFWGRDFKTFFKNSFLLKLHQPNKGGKLRIHLACLRFFLFSFAIQSKSVPIIVQGFHVFTTCTERLQTAGQPDRQEALMYRKGGDICDMKRTLPWKICILSSSHSVHYTSPSQANFALKLNTGFLWVWCLFIKSNASCCQQQSLL